jgi:hypothetical protein
LLDEAPGIVLRTRRNDWDVPNELRKELPRVILEAGRDLFTKERPDARLRSLTNLYNCVGMVLASRRVWVDPMYLHRMLAEDGYTKLSSSRDAEIGDIVVYHKDGEISHVGIVIRKNLYSAEMVRDPLDVLSKWGRDGEYEHGLTDVPYWLGAPAEYWTDRKGSS